MVISLSLQRLDTMVRSYGIIEFGATGFAFMDEKIAVSHGLKPRLPQHTYELEALTDVLIDREQ